MRMNSEASDAPTSAAFSHKSVESRHAIAVLLADQDSSSPTTSGITPSTAPSSLSSLRSPNETGSAMPDKVIDLLAAKEDELRALQRLHEDFVASSGEYEKELEGELARGEQRTRALEKQVGVSGDTITTLQQTLAATQLALSTATEHERGLHAQIEAMKWKIQRLEQCNDELETATRVTQASMEELQHRVETLIEENVFLQHEKEEAVAAMTTTRQAATIESVSPDDQELYSLAVESDRTNSRRRSRRTSSRFPDVVESCLHITCNNTCDCERRRAAAVAMAMAMTSPVPTVLSTTVSPDSSSCTASGPSVAATAVAKKTKKSLLERFRRRFLRML